MLLLLALILTPWPDAVRAHRVAVAQDGVAVLLRDNGRWEFLDWPDAVRAPRIVVTQDGIAVVLRENGTWEFFEKPQGTAAPDFRQANWGMRKDQVKKLEKVKIIQEGTNTLMYQGKLSAFNVSIWYVFVSNSFVRGVYVIHEKHVNSADHIADYSVFKYLLLKKYGKPNDDEIYWKDNLYFDDPQQWGTALGVGHLVYHTAWDTERTKITMRLTGDHSRISHTIHYQSKKLLDLDEKLMEKKALDDL